MEWAPVPLKPELVLESHIPTHACERPPIDGVAKILREAGRVPESIPGATKISRGAAHRSARIRGRMENPALAGSQVVSPDRSRPRCHVRQEVVRPRALRSRQQHPAGGLHLRISRPRPGRTHPVRRLRLAWPLPYRDEVPGRQALQTLPANLRLLAQSRPPPPALCRPLQLRRVLDLRLQHPAPGAG